MRAASTITERAERLLALGSLSAGLTHELNNPAAAAAGPPTTLRERVAGMRHKLAMLADGKFDPERLRAGRPPGGRRSRAETAPDLTALEASDREDELGDWLEDHGIAGAWDFAPTFVEAGSGHRLAGHGRARGARAGPSRARSAGSPYTIETELLMNEIADATGRISALVARAKQYSQMDRAPYQRSTCTSCLRQHPHDVRRASSARASGRQGVRPRRCPRSRRYPGELNQVWTNIIDNAVDARRPAGTAR